MQSQHEVDIKLENLE